MSIVLDNVYQQRVLQTVTSLLVALLVFRTHDLRKITKKYISPARKPDFRYQNN